MSGRTLTDADVAAIVEGLYEKAKADFYSDLGKGVWSFVWKCATVGLIGMAAFGGLKGIK